MYKIGDRVKIIKTGKIGLIATKYYWPRDKTTGYEVSIDGEFPLYYNKDLQLITGKSKSPRQFVLLKDTPTHSKGCIFTKLITSYTTEDRTVGYLENTVETQPEWFNEVFEEEPKETIKIGELVYDKKEFEKCVKDLKPIK
jgi:hypothetical protein